MWFVFPQLDGLARSATSKIYAIKNLEEARAYLHHPILGLRLIECSRALLQITGKSAYAIMGTPDDLKLRSSMTLFSSIANPPREFVDVLNTYFDGQPDIRTTDLLRGLGHT